MASKLKNENDIIRRSSSIDWVCPKALVKAGVQLNVMNRANAHEKCPKRQHLPLKERQKDYDATLEKIKRDGFNPKHPIVIFVNRLPGRDIILQGHHRLSIAIDLGLELVPVLYVY